MIARVLLFLEKMCCIPGVCDRSEAEISAPGVAERNPFHCCEADVCQTGTQVTGDGTGVVRDVSLAG